MRTSVSSEIDTLVTIMLPSLRTSHAVTADTEPNLSVIRQYSSERLSAKQFRWDETPVDQSLDSMAVVLGSPASSYAPT